MRLIFTVITLLLLFFLSSGYTSTLQKQGVSSMHKKSHTAIQNKIQDLANDYNIPDISITWTTDDANNSIATLTSHGISKKIKFSEDEFTDPTYKLSKKTLTKINNTLLSFPNTREPSPRRSQ